MWDKKTAGKGLRPGGEVGWGRGASLRSGAAVVRPYTVLYALHGYIIRSWLIVVRQARKDLDGQFHFKPFDFIGAKRSRSLSN